MLVGTLVEVAPCCAWGMGPTSRAKALLNSVDFWLEFSSPFSRIGSPYLMCLTQKLLFEQCQDLLLPGYTCLPPARYHEEDQPSVEMGPQPQ